MVKCGNLLIAARGSSIDSFSLEDGSLLSTWKCPSTQEVRSGRHAPEVTTKLVAQNSESSVEITIDASSPPAKKRKLSASDPTPVPKEVKKKQNNRSDAVASGLEAPAVTALTAAKGGRHVIAVTGEDKSIRVFENSKEDGVNRLKQLSQR